MTNPVVQTQYGEISGAYNKRGDIAIFKGIPYAQPPVGPLRWKPPQPVSPWTGILKAEKAGPTAIQLKAEGIQQFFAVYFGGQGWDQEKTAAVMQALAGAPVPEASEDCLYLNLRTPSLDGEAKLPVVVWIHGGDHQFSSGDDPFMSPDSSALSRRGVVTVAINYRLGLMGYFAHPELSRESEQGVSGNYGTLDQIAALRWVQENISAFGGDPGNVTIFGESAGGESVAHMMTSPLAEGLFHKAIMESPADQYLMMFLRQPFLYNPAGEELGQRFADRFIPTGEGQLAALRGIPADQLYELLNKEEEFQHFFPVVDGYVLEKSPYEAFRDGDQARVPLLLGNNADEASLFFPIGRTPVIGHRDVAAGEVAGLIREVYGAQAEALMDLYPGLRQGRNSAQNDFLGDNLWGLAVHHYATCAVRAGQPVYRYLFTRTPPSPKQTLGAYHMAEIAFVHDQFMPMFDFTEEDKALAQAMGDYWVQFAKAGDPNMASRPEWPAYTADDPRQMRLGIGSELGAIGVDRQAKLELLRQHLLGLIEEMKQLRQSEMEAEPA
ncbi:MAG: carboxylesterase family protein [Chloroflexota bacterium]|nr:MAG: carboxylesterase family protein [Chloroflexota bacterium]